MQARWFSSLIFILALASEAAAAAIPVQELDGAGAREAGPVALQAVLAGEVPGVATHALTIVGPGRHHEEPSLEHDVVWVFLSGAGVLRAGQTPPRTVEGETIAWAPRGWAVSIEVPAGQVLRALRVRQQRVAQDPGDTAAPLAPPAEPYVKQIRDCATYADAKKSAKTASRIVLPEGHVPGVVMGTVETEGPDAVGAHRHPWLDQLFLGLDGNDITVTAEDARAALGAFGLLHIPLGSYHGAEVAAGKKLRYLWMDFVLDREAAEAGKTHSKANSR